MRWSPISARARGRAVGLVIIGDSAIDYRHAVTHYTPLNLADEETSPASSSWPSKRTGKARGSARAPARRHDGYGKRSSAQGVRLSPVPSPGIPGSRHEKDAVDIDRRIMDGLTRQYCESAERLMRAGSTRCSSTAGTAGLLSQFLSAEVNTRTDEYGGCLENRMSLPPGGFESLHDTVGHKMAVDMRVSVGRSALAPYGGGFTEWSNLSGPLPVHNKREHLREHLPHHETS